MREAVRGARKRTDFFPYGSTGDAEMEETHLFPVPRKAFEDALPIAMAKAHAFAKHLAGRKWQEADDALQHALAGAWKNNATIEPGKLAAYLKVAIQRYFVAQSRPRQRYEQLWSDIFAEPWEPSEDDVTADVEIEERLDLLLSLRGRMADHLLRVLRSMILHRGVEDRVVQDLNIAPRSLHAALSQIRQWPGEQDERYLYWKLFFSFILADVILSQSTVASIMGRCQITVDEIERHHCNILPEMSLGGDFDAVRLLDLLDIRVPAATVAFHNSHYMKTALLKEMSSKIRPFLQDLSASKAGRAPKRHPVLSALIFYEHTWKENEPGLYKHLAPYLASLIDLAIRLPHPMDVRVS